MSQKDTANRRQQAREVALQGLYQWAIHPKSLAKLMLDLKPLSQQEDLSLEKADWRYVEQLLSGAIEAVAILDEHITPALDRDISQIDAIELAILRLSVYELKHELAVPVPVVINEAILLAKRYAAAKSYQFVNGVLDKIHPGLRKIQLGD